MTPADLSLLAAFAQAAHSARITGPQLAMLIAISEHPESHITQISDATGIRYSSGSHYPLRQRGLIDVTTKITPAAPFKTGPRKMNHLTITKDGLELLAQMHGGIVKALKPKQESTP